MISPIKKNVENQKLADKRPQPFETSVKVMVAEWNKAYRKRHIKTNPAGSIKKRKK